jgi:hypothetical protein
MTQEQAVDTNEPITQENLNENGSDVELVESAPIENAEATEDQDKADAIQQRINKEVSRRYAEKNRADKLQERLDKIEAAPNPTEKAPTLEDHEFDEEAFNAANIKYQVQAAVNAQQEARDQQKADQGAEATQQAFNDRITALNKADFADVANALPLLPDGVANALMQSESGPDLIYYLGTNLDQADALAGMSPPQAMMELGRISANMNTVKTVKHSSAPDPIQPLNSSGSIVAQRGPAGATFE